jgi:hypothetical protein
MSDDTSGSNQSQSQAIEGYKCSCGYMTDDKGKFFHHMGVANRADGPGVHKSEGRVNMTTGEITMPPYEQRTKEQKLASVHAKRTQKLDMAGKVTAVRTTDILASASEIKFIPRIFTTTYTPIMHQAQDAAVRWFGWPANMSFEDFLDTVLFKAFKMWGIELGQYGVDETLVKAAEERKKQAELVTAETAENTEPEEQ